MYYALIGVFLLSLVLVKIVVSNAPKWGLMDVPNGRSAHRNHTPRGAGIGFYFAVAIILPLFYSELLSEHWLVLLAIFLVLLVGILDDHRDTAPKTKFVVLALSTVIIYLDGIYIDHVGIYFGMNVSLGWFALPFTVFAVMGFTNALNLIDGLDGLAGSLSIVILSAFFYIGVVHHDLFLLIFAGAFIAALFAFLVYNWNPASIFMGDSGSLTLGFLISVLAIKSLDYIPAVAVLFIAAVPLLDTFIVMIRRKRNGRSMFSADKCHMHHLLQSFFGNSTKVTVVFLVVLQVIYTMIGLQFSIDMEESVPMVIFGLNVVLLYLLLNRMAQRQERNC
ncbi:glycosyltransferase family 4 protein [Sulfurovum mangrovi]|uniref:glycosyltransferase family 4 protein n=1 Tax=Sulfurovum mangrovi TaxID=2893889 RepID=UPI001E37BFC4|nr:MraY family glycosyltransferase [Sulfurovum mangrovi]UFH58551.1 undecaprenyl/decaprenyl-phosphate alpha-N-acetylglucosaminyl 1-phosphate transferase [Sulfurovum mangrovi]